MRVDPKHFGQRLTDLLRQLGMSQRELAIRTNLTPAAISQFISGAREPSLTSICKILNVIPVNFERLCGDLEL